MSRRILHGFAFTIAFGVLVSATAAPMAPDSPAKIKKQIAKAVQKGDIDGAIDLVRELAVTEDKKTIETLFDIGKTYANIITSTYLDGGAIPIIMNTDQEAIQLAVKTVVRVKPEDTKIVRIATTLDVVDIHVSEPMLPFIEANPSMFEVVGEPEPFKFDSNGTLYPMLAPHHEQVTA